MIMLLAVERRDLIKGVILHYRASTYPFITSTYRGIKFPHLRTNKARGRPFFEALLNLRHGLHLGLYTFGCTLDLLFRAEPSCIQGWLGNPLHLPAFHLGYLPSPHANRIMSDHDIASPFVR
ncbi:hypothetical protein VNO77_26887 [Canavalia gladiata]|uniref:Uncharacterized protein n=1 Tax=Canavalia gladiata TaxID=3824 RepID=A0AAN9KT21_CANGL